ncbi:13038_t:CDS:1, partial [Dentiscutata erythropus]
HGPKNASKANTYASEALRHSPDNHASPFKRYTIVNMRKRGEPFNQANPFYIFDEKLIINFLEDELDVVY